MSRRTRTEVFSEIFSKIKERKSVVRAELCREVLTNNQLYDSCVEAMKETKMIDSKYEIMPSGRQREVLIATPNLDRSELQIRALSKVISPTLSEMFNEWTSRRYPIRVGSLTESQKEKLERGSKFCDLLYKLVKEGKNDQSRKA